MGRTRQRKTAPSLTPELWATVFAHLEQRPAYITLYDASRRQAEVHQLKLVCKQFRSILESHSELVQRLYLHNHFSFALLPSLLAWLHQNKGAIREFWSNCKSPLVDIVMAGLLSAPSIGVVDILDVSACTLPLVGTYNSLEECTFRHRKSEHVGLAPLGGLPKLRQLRLQGKFMELQCLTGLTQLECESCFVLGAQELPPALQCLALTHSEFVGVHADTLPACTALARLLLENASLRGNNEYVYLDRNFSVVPTNIGQLTQLHTLHLTADRLVEEPVDLTWVSELTSLQELSMIFDHSSGDIFQHVSLLTNLTYLDISGFDTKSKANVLHVEFEWLKLQALRKLFIDLKRIYLSESIFDLLRLPKLHQVCFAHSIVHGPDTCTERFAALIYKFAKLRPEVKLFFGNGDLVA